jgi:uncharacterized membrane protein
MKLTDWFWKAAEKLVFAGLVVFILVPFRLEVSFVRELYHNQPVFCVGLLTAVAAFVIATAMHFTQERQKRKLEKRQPVSNRGTL